jgi:hypothetical protein
MKAFKRDGVAIIFVSHNMQAVGDLCDEALVIKGHPRSRGSVGAAVAAYLAISGQEGATLEGDGLVADELTLTGADDGRPVVAVTRGRQVALEVSYRVTRPLDQLVWSMVLRRATDGIVVSDGSYTSDELGLGALAPGDHVRVRFAHTIHLARGQYAYEVNVYDPGESRNRLRYQPAAVLRVDEYRSYSGVADLELLGTAQFQPAAGGERVP